MLRISTTMYTSRVRNVGNIIFCDADSFNLVPRVLRLFGQWLVSRRDSGELEFYHRRISAVKVASRYGAANQKIQFFSNSPVSPGDQPLPKEREDSGYEIDSVYRFM